MLSSDINWSLAILPSYFDTQSLPTLLHIIFSYPTCKRYEGRIEISKDQCDRENIESLPSIFFKDRRDRFAHGRSFSKIDECKSIPLILKKDRRAKIERSESRFFVFSSESLVFWERFAYGQSFSIIDESNSITVDLFWIPNPASLQRITLPWAVFFTPLISGVWHK